MKVLIEFHHGLGDCVQFTSVLKHLKKYKPEWKITLHTREGKDTVGLGLCDESTSGIPSVKSFHRKFKVRWMESTDSHNTIPSTKVEKCLREEFHIPIDKELLTYTQNIRSEALEAAKNYLESINAVGKRTLLIHYEGNTSASRKNISSDIAKAICTFCVDNGIVPIILDWDRRSQLPNNSTIFCPDANNPLWRGLGTGDAERIAALISLCTACIGIDSGPGHLMTTTATPALMICIKQHPVHYFPPTENVVHLVPTNHSSLLRSIKPGALDFFKSAYKHIEYTNLAYEIFNWVCATFEVPMPNPPLIKIGEFFVRQDNIEQDFVIIRDLIDNDAYKLAVIPERVRQAKVVVDIGAHIGVFAKRIHDLNPKAKIVCVEVCPENIEALTKNVGHFATIINAACTYSKEEIMLLNAVRPNCESTGGNTVIPKASEPDITLRQKGYAYWHDYRPIEKITLEQILEKIGETEIDILKLDCEGSEFSILGETPSLDKIKFIVGEYHSREMWLELLARRFANWDYGQMYSSSNGLGLFHLRNRDLL